MTHEYNIIITLHLYENLGDKLMSEYSDLLKKYDKQITKVNEAIMNTEFHEISTIYSDLVLLKDLRMGLMISLANSEERKYLLSKLAEYNYRPVRDFTYTYPEFKYSETELNQMYHDQERSDTIFNYSPDTDFSLTANELLRSITSQNTRVKYTKTVTWYINTYPLKITENMQIYATMLEEYVQHAAEIKLISVNPFTVDSNIWSNCQLLAIDDMLSVTKPEHTLNNVLFESHRLLNSAIYAPYVCDPSVLHKWHQHHINLADPKAEQEIFTVTEMMLNLYCHFTFIPFSIPLPNIQA